MNEAVNKNISSDEIQQFFDDNGLTEEMDKTKSDIIRRIEILGERITEHTGHPAIDHIVSRVKSPESIIRKLKKKKRDVTPQNAVSTLHDIVGIRAVCPFQDDVFYLAREIRDNIGYPVINYKDFVSNPKSSGYRSIHIILECLSESDNKFYAEVQVRSVAMNYWAILDHLLCYKNEDKRVKEFHEQLKRHAEEIADIDRKLYKLRRKIEKLK